MSTTRHIRNTYRSSVDLATTIHCAACATVYPVGYDHECWPIFEPLVSPLVSDDPDAYVPWIKSRLR